MEKLFFESDKEFYSIGEVSKIIGLPSHTLRYWESEFGALRPLRRDSRHRKYTLKDIDKIRKVRELLHKKKFTIEGAKKAFLESEREKSRQLNLDIGTSSAAASALKEVKKEIEAVIARLKE